MARSRTTDPNALEAGIDLAPPDEDGPDRVAQASRQDGVPQIADEDDRNEAPGRDGPPRARRQQP